jgi:hypothetical protein
MGISHNDLASQLDAEHRLYIVEVFNYNTISMSSLSGRMDFTEDE